MRKLYEKSELTFALVWIGIYIVLFSLSDALSDSIGVSKLITAITGTAMSVCLLLWTRKSGLWEKCGLCFGNLRWRPYLWFLPLALMASVNFWGGITLRLSALETVLYVISMLSVGFLEELIFRVFLFRALCRDSIPRAFWISSLTFGIGHILNLLSGAELFTTLLQILYATAGGMLFTVIFYRSGSLLPCIAAHCLINALDAFSAPQSVPLQICSAVGLTIIALAYAAWIWRYTEPAKDNTPQNG